MDLSYLLMKLLMHVWDFNTHGPFRKIIFSIRRFIQCSSLMNVSNQAFCLCGYKYVFWWSRSIPDGIHYRGWWKNKIAINIRPINRQIRKKRFPYMHFFTKEHRRRIDVYAHFTKEHRRRIDVYSHFTIEHRRRIVAFKHLLWEILYINDGAHRDHDLGDRHQPMCTN